MPSVTLACTADARLYAPNQGAGASLYLPVGLYGGNIYRSIAKFSMPNWTALGVRRITSAHIRIRQSDQFYIARGSTPRVLTQRLVESWSEGSSSVLSSSNAVRYDNQPGAVSTGETDTSIANTDNLWVNLDATAIARAWAPTSVESGGGLANHGIRIRSFDEASTARTTEFYSSESSYPPQLIINYESNTAPTAPTALSPATAESGAGGIAPVSRVSIEGRASSPIIYVAGTRADPDAGDYITSVQVQLFADAATDAVPGSALIDVTEEISGSPTTFSVMVDIASLTIGTTYRARVRTADKAGLWGAWSSLTAMRFVPDTLPAAPTNMSQDVSTQTPTFFGSLVDPDPSAAISEAHILVYQDTAAGPVLKWDSGWVASGGTRFAVAYGGTTLDFGTKYRWAAAVRDNLGGEGPLSSYVEWTPVATTGPSAMSPKDVETKQNSLTPTLTIGHGSAFDAYELEVARYDGGPADLWDVGVTTHASATSKPVTYAGAALTWGRIHYWRAKVRVGGVTWTDWSPWFPFYVNAIPTAPVCSISGSVDSGSGAYGPYRTGTTTTPTIDCPFADPDLAKGYADVPQNKQVEIRRADTLAVHGTYSPLTIAGTASSHVVSPALTSGVTYKLRVRWQDAAGQYGPWSDWLFYKPSTAFTITVGAAPSGTDPTPTFAWTNNRAQAKKRVVVTNNATGELVHDSGVIASSDQSFTLPPFLLASGVTYKYVVTAYDADSLSAVLT